MSSFNWNKTKITKFSNKNGFSKILFERNHNPQIFQEKEVNRNPLPNLIKDNMNVKWMQMNRNK